MSAYVTDTHPLIYYGFGRSRKLSKRVERIFQQCDAGSTVIYVPAAVMWEISLLARSQEIAFKDHSFAHWANSLFGKSTYVFQPLDLEVIIESHFLAFSGDPFDVQIVATARALDLPLITRDQVIVNSRLVEIMW